MFSIYNMRKSFLVSAKTRAQQNENLPPPPPEKPKAASYSYANTVKPLEARSTPTNTTLKNSYSYANTVKPLVARSTPTNTTLKNSYSYANTVKPLVARSTPTNTTLKNTYSYANTVKPIEARSSPSIPKSSYSYVNLLRAPKVPTPPISSYTVNPFHEEPGAETEEQPIEPEVHPEDEPPKPETHSDAVDIQTPEPETHSHAVDIQTPEPETHSHAVAIQTPEPEATLPDSLINPVQAPDGNSSSRCDKLFDFIETKMSNLVKLDVPRKIKMDKFVLNDACLPYINAFCDLWGQNPEDKILIGYHGTTPSVRNIILKSNNFLVGPRGLHGRGVYFATDMQTAITYNKNAQGKSARGADMRLLTALIICREEIILDVDNRPKNFIVVKDPKAILVVGEVLYSESLTNKNPPTLSETKFHNVPFLTGSTQTGFNALGGKRMRGGEPHTSFTVLDSDGTVNRIDGEIDITPSDGKTPDGELLDESVKVGGRKSRKSRRKSTRSKRTKRA